MSWYIIRRVGQAIPTLVLVAVVVFLLAHVLPGSPVENMVAGTNASQSDIAAMKARYGLDKPLWVQFLTWISGLVQGDFGTSYITGQSVTAMVQHAFPVTATLAVGALIVCVVVGIPLAVTSALNRGRPADHGILMMSLIGVSVPSFVLGIILILVFAVGLGLLPASGYAPVWASGGRGFTYFVLPSVSLGALYAANVARIGRAATLEALSQDYIVTARAAGLAEWSVRYRHALKNAMGPILTIIGVTLGWLLGGTVITERVFNLPGMGTVVINAVTRRDYPVIQTVVMLVAGVYIVINLLVDIGYAALDPRVRLGSRSG